MNSTDKALLQWRGRPFIEHIVACLLPQVDNIAINSNSDSAVLKAMGLPIIADPFAERRGPLAGILAGLDFSTTPFTLFVPCDNPLLSANLIDRLSAAVTTDNATIAYARCGDDSHYLYALIRSELHVSLAHFLQNNDFAVRHWYAAERAIAVDFSDEAERFRNINTLADLQRLPQ